MTNSIFAEDLDALNLQQAQEQQFKDRLSELNAEIMLLLELLDNIGQPFFFWSAESPEAANELAGRWRSLGDFLKRSDWINRAIGDELDAMMGGTDAEKKSSAKLIRCAAQGDDATLHRAVSEILSNGTLYNRVYEGLHHLARRAKKSLHAERDRVIAATMPENGVVQEMVKFWDLGRQHAETASVPQMPVVKSDAIKEPQHIAAIPRVDCPDELARTRILEHPTDSSTMQTSTVNPEQKVDKFAALRQFAYENMKGIEKNLLLEVANSGGRIALNALAPILDWKLPWDEQWSNAQKRVNEKIGNKGWMLSRLAGDAILKKIKSSRGVP